MWASVAGHQQVTKLLLAKGADVNATNVAGTTALFWAATTGNFEIAKLLLEEGADPNIVDKRGRTAMAVALEKGYVELVTLLKPYISKQKAPAALRSAPRDESLDEPLLTAALSGDLAEVKRLLERGADIEATDKESGGTCLMLATFQGHREVARLLLERGADVNAKASGNLTPLMVACGAGHDEIADMLLKKGADIDARSEDGLTALTVADGKGHAKLVSLLMDHMARTLWAETVVQRVDKKGECLSVRSAPSQSSSQVGCIKLGDRMKLNGIWTENNWAQVYEPVQGWVDGAYLSMESLPKEKRAVIALGQSSPGGRGGGRRVRTAEPDEDRDEVIDAKEYNRRTRGGAAGGSDADEESGESDSSLGRRRRGWR
jgi:ankyrin repeat protein